MGARNDEEEFLLLLKNTIFPTMKNIYGIDSSAPSGRIFFLFYFPGV
jgi:hypothetical protein